jgi:hypothetical protein
MNELNVVAQKLIRFLLKYWVALLTITGITEGGVLLANHYWNPFVQSLNLSFLGSLAGIVQGVLGAFMISLLTPIGKAVTAYLIEVEHPTPLAGLSVYGNTLSKIPTLLGVSFLWFLGTVIGLCLLIVPGLVIFIGGQFAAQAVVVENLGVMAAFKRSWRLVKQEITDVVLLFIAIEVGQGILSGILGALITGVIPSFNPFLLDWLLSTIVATFVYVPLAVMYLERRNVAEFDAR